jgi:nuclear pore complex protein Nup54
LEANRCAKVLEDYEKQIQHLKKEIEALGADYGEWDKGRSASSRSR